MRCLERIRKRPFGERWTYLQKNGRQYSNKRIVIFAHTHSTGHPLTPLKDRLPVSYLLFTARGRINRRTYWIASVFIWSTFYVLFNLIAMLSYGATLIIYPLLFWALAATAIKRIHD